MGHVQVPWVSRYADPVMATGYHMLLGGVPLLALSIAREGDMLLERLPQIDGDPALNGFWIMDFAPLATRT